MNSNTKKLVVLAIATSLIAGCAAEKANAKDNTSSVLSCCDNYDEEVVDYAVKKGDTLSSISRKYYSNSSYWRELAIYNNISNPNLIYVGQTIEIPELEYLLEYVHGFDCEDEKTHTVQKGETIYSICKYYYKDTSKSTMYKLATVNKLCNPNLIRTGQKLVLPPYEELLEVKSFDYSNFEVPAQQNHICDEHCYTWANLYDTITGEYLGQTRILKPHTN